MSMVTKPGRVVTYNEELPSMKSHQFYEVVWLVILITLTPFVGLECKRLSCHWLLLNKVTGLQVCNFIKKRLQHVCFLSLLRNFLEQPFFTERLRWLLLMLYWFWYLLVRLPNNIYLLYLFGLSLFCATFLFFCCWLWSDVFLEYQ